jgi:plasmid stabilization system protein ParE
VNLRFTPQALAETKRIKTWWRENRPAASDAFEQELNATLERIVQAPSLGSLYEQGDLEVPVRRVLLPKTRNHLYYAIEGKEVVVLSVWGSPRGRGPKL